MILNCGVIIFLESRRKKKNFSKLVTKCRVSNICNLNALCIKLNIHSLTIKFIYQFQLLCLILYIELLKWIFVFGLEVEWIGCCKVSLHLGFLYPGAVGICCRWYSNRPHCQFLLLSNTAFFSPPKQYPVYIAPGGQSSLPQLTTYIQKEGA